MNTSPLAAFTGSKRFRAAAFTLLELLVVISIISVLAGILLPVTSSVMENARKTEAKSTVMQIVTAVKSFQTDYGVYPNPTNATGDKTWTNVTNQDLFAVLRAIETSATPVNTRRVVYFEGKDVKNASTPKSGFATQTVSKSMNGATYAVNMGGLTDPWGNGYYIRYDSGYSDAVKHPYSNDADGQDDTAGASDSIRFGVIAWSYGKDGMKGNAGTVGAPPSYTYGDDVVSWQ